MLCQVVKAAAAARVQAQRPRHVVEPKLTADSVLSRATGAMVETTEKIVVDWRLDRRNRSTQNFAGGTSRRRSGHGDRAAYAGDVYPGFCQSPGYPLRDHRQGGGAQRHGDPRAGADRAGQSPYAAETQRRALLRGYQGRTARLPSPPLGGCPVSLRRPLRGDKMRWE